MIAVECYLDTYVVQSLGFSRKSIKHLRGKGKVIKRVREEMTGPIVGLIDEDPGAPQDGDMKNYVIRESINGLKLFSRRNDETRSLIQIQPMLEEWILHRAKHNGISIKDFGLPDDAQELHKTHIEDRENFRRFYNRLLESNDEEIEKLKEWIQEAL
jgi:hypothetical protein